jgi:hypothetical protein
MWRYLDLEARKFQFCVLLTSKEIWRHLRRLEALKLHTLTFSNQFHVR